VRPRRGCATATMQGEVKERGDNDAGEAAESVGCAAARAPSHGPARLPGRHRMELLGHGRVGLYGRWGAMTVSSSGLHGRLDKTLGERSWRPRGASG
jgi:hypothetical protein